MSSPNRKNILFDLFLAQNGVGVTSITTHAITRTHLPHHPLVSHLLMPCHQECESVRIWDGLCGNVWLEWGRTTCDLMEGDVLQVQGWPGLGGLSCYLFYVSSSTSSSPSRPPWLPRPIPSSSCMFSAEIHTTLPRPGWASLTPTTNSPSHLTKHLDLNLTIPLTFPPHLDH